MGGEFREAKTKRWILILNILINTGDVIIVTVKEFLTLAMSPVRDRRLDGW